MLFVHLFNLFLECACISVMTSYKDIDPDDPFGKPTGMTSDGQTESPTADQEIHAILRFVKAIDERFVHQMFSRLFGIENPKVHSVRNITNSLRWSTSSDPSPAIRNVDLSDLSLMAQTHMWALSYDIDIPEPYDSDPFLMAKSNYRISLINAFKDIRAKRIHKLEINNFPGCSACEYTKALADDAAINAENPHDIDTVPCTCLSSESNVCGLLACICYFLKFKPNVRLFICGNSGMGKTRSIQSHFSSLLTFLPVANNEQFPMDGFDSQKCQLVYFDEFQEGNHPRWLLLRLMDRQYFSVNTKFKNVIQCKYMGPIAFSSVSPPSPEDHPTF